MAVHTFQRVEKKYQLTKEQLDALMEKIGDKIKPDKFGLHTIRNVYFDTDDFELIRTSIEKPKYKEKFRVRGYGEIVDDSKVYLEIKKKYQGVVYKRRISLPYAEARAYLDEGVKPQQADHIFKEIDYFLNHYKPTEKIYLAYDRIAYVGVEEGELRLTIDRNIRSRYHNLVLSEDVIDINGDGQMNGGTFWGIGSAQMAMNPSSESQGVIAGTVQSTIAEGTKIVIKDAQGNVVTSFTAEKEGQWIGVTAPEIEKNASYTILVGDIEYSATAG